MITHLPFYYFAWVSSIIYAFNAILAKLVSKHMVKNPWLFNFLWNLAILIFIAAITATQQKIVMPAHWSNILLAGLFYALGGIFYLLSLYRLDVSVLAPLFNFRSIFTLLLGVFLLHEAFSAYQAWLLLVIFIAGVFVTYQEHWRLQNFFSKSIALAMIEMLVLAPEALFLNKAMPEQGFWNTTFWMVLISQIMLLATLPMFYKEIKGVTRKQSGFFLLLALVSTAATLAANKAYQANIGISSIIISLPISMIFAYMFSVFAPALLEKHTNKVYFVRFVSAAIMFLGAIQLTK